MKLLSVGIPCYNSMAYMDKAIDSVLVCRDDVEIIIVNDGSKDETDRIGKEYAEKYPDCVKYVYQENGGHGQAVNTGLANATGRQYKVLDSDDWFDSESLKKVIAQLKEFELSNTELDMLIVNYVYDKPSENKQVPIHYTNVLPQNRVFTWDDIKPFPIGKYLLMHSVIYKTQVLRDCGLELPKHTFYVDNIFVFEPLPNIKHIYYLNVDFYRYFIGRDDQSVNEKVMISRLDQQMRVNRIMANYYSKQKISNVFLDKYMFNFIAIVTAVSSILAIKSGKEEHLAMKDQLWADLKAMDKKLYRKLRWATVFGVGVNLPGKFGRKLAVLVYKAAQKIYGFN